jgi:hypothetical protein
VVELVATVVAEAETWGRVLQEKLLAVYCSSVQKEGD